MTKPKTQRQLEKQKELLGKHTKLGWFFIPQDYKCTHGIILKAGWHQKVGTYNVSEKCTHSVKHKKTREYNTISEVDYQKIINNFKDRNAHLFEDLEKK